VIPLRYPLVWWGLGCLLVAGVAVGSLIPARVIEGTFSLGDKALHLLAYFVLTFWFAGLCRRERYWILALAVFAFGFALELAQSGTSSRSFDPGDAIANTGGILLALALAWFLFVGWCRRVEQLVFS
jgi:VanZ family protein